MLNKLFAGIATLLLLSGQAMALKGKLTIVTSYPPATTTTFKAAFEKNIPASPSRC